MSLPHTYPIIGIGETGESPVCQCVTLVTTATNPVFMILTVKEVSVLLDCTERTAERHMAKIRKKTGVKHITKWHLADYLDLDCFAIEISYQLKVAKNIDYAFKLVQQRDKYFNKTTRSYNKLFDLILHNNK